MKQLGLDQNMDSKNLTTLASILLQNWDALDSFSFYSWEDSTRFRGDRIPILTEKYHASWETKYYLD